MEESFKNEDQCSMQAKNVSEKVVTSKTRHQNAKKKNKKSRVSDEAKA